SRPCVRRPCGTEAGPWFRLAGDIPGPCRDGRGCAIRRRPWRPWHLPWLPAAAWYRQAACPPPGEGRQGKREVPGRRGCDASWCDSENGAGQGRLGQGHWYERKAGEGKEKTGSFSQGLVYCKGPNQCRGRGGKDEVRA